MPFDSCKFTNARRPSCVTSSSALTRSFEPPVVEESPTRARRPRRLVDLFAVLTEGTSTTSTAPLAQNIVELYGLLPTVADDVAGALFLLSDPWQPAAEDWPVPWTTMDELKSGTTSGNSKAFMSVYVLDVV